MAFFERQIRSGLSELTIYSQGTDTMVIHVLDNDTFSDGTHDARIELPIREFNRLMAGGVYPDTHDMNKRVITVGELDDPH